MATVKKEIAVEKVLAADTSLIEFVNDKKSFEVKITKAEKGEFKSSKGEQWVKWDFQSIVLDEQGKELEVEYADGTKGVQWLRFSTLIGKKSDAKPNYNYKAWGIAAFGIDEDLSYISGTEILDKIKEVKYFLVTLKALPAYVNKEGVEYAQYNFVGVEPSMITTHPAGTFEITEDLDLWDN